MLAASEPSGTSFAPSIRQSWCSHGSRTSTKNNFSPRSSRAFTSAGAISNSSIYFPFQIGGRFFIKHEFLRARLASSSASSSIRVVELGTGTLLALKLRRPLFEERANSLVAIFRQETTHLLLHFIVERLGQFFFSAGKKRPLYRADGQRRTVSDLLRKRLHFRLEPRAGNDLVDQAYRQRAFRIDDVAGVEKFRGFRATHQLRQKIRSAIIGK